MEPGAVTTAAIKMKYTNGLIPNMTSYAANCNNGRRDILCCKHWSRTPEHSAVKMLCVKAPAIWHYCTVLYCMYQYCSRYHNLARIGGGVSAESTYLNVTVALMALAGSVAGHQDKSHKITQERVHE